MTKTVTQSEAPLAFRLRPKTLEEFFGQAEIVGFGTPLRTSIENDTLTSVIFAGPPGTGKTTLAHIIAERTNAQFVRLNAVTSGVADIKSVCSEAERMKESFRQKTVLFIDEIHRFNKSQQDALLPFVENGTVILIGATTENPYFSVNSALISRSQIYLLKPLNVTDLEQILARAVEHSNGFSKKLKISKAALKHIAESANGDARIALNLLELASLTIGSDVSLEQAEKLLKERSYRYDKKGEDHYDTISAFIKTMRGSDIDAALIWLYKMIISGEDPRFIFRRMMIFASEDIGNADPQALQFVVSAWQAFEMVGMPEGEYFLAHSCIYLTQAPKSNAITNAMYDAKAYVDKASSLEVPYHLRNAPVKAMNEQGYIQGYKYPHNAPEGIVSEQYFPIGQDLVDFYHPTKRGYEADISARWEKTKAHVRGTLK